MDRTLKSDHSLKSCLFFNFTQLVNLENLSVYDLTLLGVKGLIKILLITNYYIIIIIIIMTMLKILRMRIIIIITLTYIFI